MQQQSVVYFALITHYYQTINGYQLVTTAVLHLLMCLGKHFTALKDKLKHLMLKYHHSGHVNALITS